MKYKNFGIKTSQGKFYEGFKTPQPNSVPFEKDGTTYHHVIYDQIEGKLHSVKIEEGEYGTKLRVSLNDKAGDAQVLKFPLLTDRGGVDDWARSFAVYMSQLNLGDNVSLSLNTKDRDKKDYLYKNFFVKVDGTNLKFGFSHKDAPPGVKTTVKDKVTKKDKEVWDFSDRDAWYYDIIKKEVDRLGGQNATSAAAATEPGYSDLPDDDDSSDLPF